MKDFLAPKKSQILSQSAVYQSKYRQTLKIRVRKDANLGNVFDSISTLCFSKKKNWSPF
jgi:hypothetical protein